MSDVTDQIKERLNVVDVLGEYLRLEKAGSNYRALCPFHNEKTPSFMVNPERNFWYCFGCQKGGDIFTFVQEMEGIEFREALEKLAERAGVEIPKYQNYDSEGANRKKKTLEILEIATRFYEKQLAESNEGKKVRAYLLGRKIDPAQLKNFRVGFAPDGWENIKNYLLGMGYKISDIEAAGLLVKKEGQPKESAGSYYDRFRNRIMFPVIDVNGKSVGFSARVTPRQDESSAKYINTPQTIVYDKSQVLYGIYQAKTEIKKQNAVIIVEGNVDVLASFSAGLGNIIAVSGTALTKQHVGVLKRYASNFKFCFDMDEAGQRATRKSIQTCLEEAMEPEIILLPTGIKDVNDAVMKDLVLWKTAVEKAVPVMEYFFRSALSRYDLNDPRGKKMIAYELLNVIKDIGDPIEQSYWLKKLSDKVEVDEEVLTGVLEKAKVRKDVTSDQSEDEERKEKNKSRLDILLDRFLGLFSLFFGELQETAKEVDENIFDETRLKIWEAIKNDERTKISQLLNELELEVRYSYDEKAGFIENEINPFEEKNILLREILKERKKMQLKKIAYDIKRAEEENDEEAVELLSGEFSKLSEEINKF